MIGTLHLETDAPSMTGADVTGQTFKVLHDVARERQRQDRRWGEQSHPPELWLAILTEEVGEVAKEIAESSVRPLDVAAYREELVQVAGVAISAIEALDYGAAGLGRSHAPAPDSEGRPPVRNGWEGSD